MRIAIFCLACLLALPALARDDSVPRDFGDRPAVSYPLRFTDLAGNVFHPEWLVMLTPAGALAAPLPDTSSDARSEERVDLSGLPLIGNLFYHRLAPGDAALQGELVGPLFRIGAMLIIDTTGPGASPAGHDVMLTANLPNDGAVSYRLGQLRFAPAETPAGTRTPAGAAYLVAGTLVLAAEGGGPLIEDWRRFFNNNI